VVLSRLCGTGKLKEVYENKYNKYSLRWLEKPKNSWAQGVVNTMIEFLSQVGAVDTTLAREKIQRIRGRRRRI
jgi:hypothetical protein